MTFLHPILFAAGLAAVAIPILIHLLLRQRRRPIMWGAMRFLLEAYRRQRNRLRIEQWLLLAARCLLLALLGAALARPLLAGAGLLGGAPGRDVYILLDNSIAASLTTSADGRSAAAIERHKQAASRLLSSLGPGDRAGLILLGRPVQTIVVPASPDVAAVRRLVQEQTPTDSAADLPGALAAVASALAAPDGRERPATLVILSDFLAGSADLSQPLSASLADRPDVRILASTPADHSADPANVQVLSVEPLRPIVITGTSRGTPTSEPVRVSLRRTGRSLADAALTTLRVRLEPAEGEGEAPVLAAQSVIRWQPGQADAVVSLGVAPPAYESASLLLTAEIDRDSLPADNVFRRPVNVREALRVGIVSRSRFSMDAPLDRMSPAQWLRLALRPTPATPIDPIDIDPASLDAPTLASLEALLLPAPNLVRDEDWERIRRFADAGGLVVVSPPPDTSVHLWTDIMVRALGLPWRLGREAKAFDPPIALDDRPPASNLLSLIAAEIPGLARPVSVQRALPAEELGRETDQALKLRDGTPWLVADAPGSAENDASRPGASLGLVVYLASAPSLAWTDLPAKPLVVPLLQEIMKQGFGRAAGTWSTVAGRPVAVPARTASLQPVGKNEPRDSIAVSRAGVAAEPLRRAGVWRAADEAGRFRGVIAVNPDADGGRTAPQPPDAVRAWLAGAFGAEHAAEASRTRLAWIDDTKDAALLASRPVESPFSLPLLVAVLAVALAELVMARFFSHAFADPVAPPRVAEGSAAA